MTTFDRFDPFERRIGEALDGIAPMRPLDYLDDVFRQTARTSQRPRWSFPERWFNVDTTLTRPVFGRNLPVRQLMILALLVALAAAAIGIYAVGTKHLPSPIGPAGNGQIVYGYGGDLYVRDSMTSEPRLLIGGTSEQGGPAVSPDGQLIAYDNVVNDVDHVFMANIDGSNPRQVLDQPFSGGTFAWSYDSRAAVAVTDSAGFNQLWYVSADPAGTREIALDGLWPQEATWDPTRPNVLLVRAAARTNNQIDLYYVDVHAATPVILSKIDMPEGKLLYGPYWDDVAITFSPDGSTIAYAVLSEATATLQHFRTHLMDRDGTNDREIALPDPSAANWPVYSKDLAPYSQSWPVFSPDGKTIAMESWYTTPTGAVNTIAIAPTDLSGPTVLVGPSFPNHSLIKGWSPDGTRLMVIPSDTNDVYSIDPISKESEQLPWQMDYVPAWQRVAR